MQLFCVAGSNILRFCLYGFFIYKNMDFKKMFCSTPFISVNISLAKEIGLNEAIIFALMQSIESNKLDNEGYFCLSSKEIEEEITLTYSQQKTAIDNLIRLELIYQKKAGMPCKNYYKINIL